MGRISIALVLLAFAPAVAADASLVFEENRGQIASDATFFARAGASRVLLRATGVEIGTAGGRDSLELLFLDAEPGQLAGFEKIDGDVPAFGRVARSTPYPGIGVVFRGDERSLAIELTVAPGADPSAIRFGLRGAQTVRLEGGDAVATLRDGEIRLAVAGGIGNLVGDGADALGLRMAPGGVEPRAVSIVARFLEAEAPEAPPVRTVAAGCPGTIQFTNGGGTGLWQTAANWSLGHVPLATDDVCIPAGFAVTLSTSAQSVSSVYVAATSSLVLSQSLTLAAASQFDGSLTVQVGGTLTGAADITCNGAVTWTGGTISGAASMSANAGLAVSGASAHDLTGGRALHVFGASSWTGTGSLRVGTAGSITNHGTWDSQSNASFVNLSSPGAFTNLAGATFQKTVATGTSAVPIPFNNAGTVSVVTGTLNLNGGGAHAGAFTASAGTVLDFGGGTHALASGSSIAAPSVLFDAGTITIDGAYAVSSATTIAGAAVTFGAASTLTSIGSALSVSSGSVSFGSGETVSPGTLAITAGTVQGSDTINVSGLTTWSGGTMTGAGTINANGGAALGTASTKDLTGGRVLNTSGTTTWTGTGIVRLGTGGTINNAGTWDAQSDSQFFPLTSAGPFTNLAGALFKKSAGAGATLIGVPYLNAGTINVLSGTLTLSGSGTQSGTLTASAGTTLRFNGGTHALASGSSTTGSSIVFDAGTITIDGSYAFSSDTTIAGAAVTFNAASTLTSIGSALTVGGGSVTFGSGETVSPATLTITSGTLQGPDMVNVSGLTTWSGGTITGAGTINANGGAALGTTSTKDLTGGRVLNTSATTTWSGTGIIRLGTGGTINNAGTWDAQSDSQFFALGSAGPFTNLAGAVFKKSAGAATAVGVPFSNAGSVQALASSLQLSAGYTQTAGSTTLSGGTISSTTPLDIQGGVITGIGTATASVANGGHAVPGLSIGTLGLTGNYVQSAAGHFDVQIGGRTAGTEYDQVTVTGTAAFSGGLDVTLANGFVPAGGDSFTLMTYASSTGAFSTSSLPPLAQGCWRTFYNPTALVLEVWTVAPEVTGVKPGATKSTVAWDALPPAAGPTPTYDLMRGSLAEFPVGGKPAETCVATTTATSAGDAATPGVGSGFYYLVRGSNTCGVGGYGTRSNGTPRTPTVCP